MDTNGTAHKAESPDKENGLPFAGKLGLPRWNTSILELLCFPTIRQSCQCICAPQTLDSEQAAAVDKSRKLPEFNPGDVVEVKMVSFEAVPSFGSLKAAAL